MVYFSAMRTKLISAILWTAAACAASAAHKVPEDPDAIRWSDRSIEQMSVWEDPANWTGDVFPDGDGVHAVVDTPDICKYLLVRRPVTVGELTVKGSKKSIYGGILADGDEAVLRFKNLGKPALFDYTRTMGEVVDVPIEFERDLVVKTGGSQWAWTAVFFDTKASVTPLAPDGEATLTFDTTTPYNQGNWQSTRLFEVKRVCAIRGFVSDSLDGARLKIVKRGEGFLALACGDNDYSGGTVVEEGSLAGVNGENLDPPFLAFGRGPVHVTAEKGSVRLCSSKSGVWGPGKGYDLVFDGNARIHAGDARSWNGAKAATMDDRHHTVGSVKVGGGGFHVTLNSGAKLHVAPEGFVELSTNTVIQVDRTDESTGYRVAELDFPCAVRTPSGKRVGVVKTGNGTLRLAGDNTFSAMLVKTGGVAVASNGALGLGKALFSTNTFLFVECDAFTPKDEIVLRPGATEVWRHPGARIGGAPEGGRKGYALPAGVSLGIACDGATNRLQGAVGIGGAGARLYAYRDHKGTPEDGFRLGAGVAVVLTGDLELGNPWYSREQQEFRWENRHLASPLYIDGLIREKGGSFKLTKSGDDAVVIRGIGSYTGGTLVRNGFLTVEKGGRLGPGTVRIDGEEKQNGNRGRLTLKAPDALAPDTALEIEGGGVLSLDFQGEIEVASLRIAGRNAAPGSVWMNKSRDKSVKTDGKRIVGQGAIRVKSTAK